MSSYPSGNLSESWVQSSSQRDVGSSLHQSGMHKDSTNERVQSQYKGLSYVEGTPLPQHIRHFPSSTYVASSRETEMDPYVSKFPQNAQWQMNGRSNNMARPHDENNYRQYFDPSMGNYQLPHSGIPDPHMQVQLCDKGLWDQFSSAGTEMIVTKTGRRMFPGYRIKISGLDKDAFYCVMMDIVNVDDHRYKFQHGEWTVAGRGEPHLPQRFYLHPDSPSIGAKWMSEAVSFHKVKLTNSVGRDVDGKIVLNSMHRYQPRIHIVRTNDTSTVHLQQLCTFAFPQTVFITVTAYQNPKVTKLKIDNNPFAKGFREDGARAKKPKSSQNFDHLSCTNQHSLGEYGYGASHFSHTPVVTVSAQSSENPPRSLHQRQLHPFSNNQAQYIPELLDEASLQFSNHHNTMPGAHGAHNWGGQ